MRVELGWGVRRVGAEVEGLREGVTVVLGVGVVRTGGLSRGFLTIRRLNPIAATNNKVPIIRAFDTV